MVAITYGVGRVGAADTAPKIAQKAAIADTATPGKSWFARFYDAMIDARMKQARREIRMYAHLMPYSLDERGDRLVKTQSGDMPLGGW
jgi:hypothetical protein